MSLKLQAGVRCIASRCGSISSRKLCAYRDNWGLLREDLQIFLLGFESGGLSWTDKCSESVSSFVQLLHVSCLATLNCPQLFSALPPTRRAQWRGITSTGASRLDHKVVRGLKHLHSLRSISSFLVACPVVCHSSFRVACLAACHSHLLLSNREFPIQQSRIVFIC